MLYIIDYDFTYKTEAKVCLHEMNQPRAKHIEIKNKRSKKFEIVSDIVKFELKSKLQQVMFFQRY